MYASDANPIIPVSDLMKAFNEGEENAFLHFYRNHYYPLYKYAYKLVRDKEDAKDMVSEAMLKLWDRRRVFQLPESVKIFLYNAVTHTCFDFLKFLDRDAKNREAYADRLGHSEEMFT